MLCELVKACNFYSSECADKNVRDQLIEGIIDGDTVEDLLQIKDLTLDKAIQVCQAQEAAKKQRANVTGIHQDFISFVRNLPRKKIPIQPLPSYPATWW